MRRPNRNRELHERPSPNHTDNYWLETNRKTERVSRNENVGASSVPPARRTLCLPLFRPEAHGRERGPVPTALAGKLGRPHQHQTNPIPERGTVPEGRFIMTMGSVQRAEVHKHTSAGTGPRNARRKQTPAEPCGETGSSTGSGHRERPPGAAIGRLTHSSLPSNGRAHAPFRHTGLSHIVSHKTSLSIF